MFTKTKNSILRYFLAALLLAAPALLWAQTAAPAAPAVTDGYTVLRYVLVAVALLFGMIIVVLAFGLKSAAEINLAKRKKERLAARASSAIITLLMFFTSFAVQAQNTAAATAPPAAPKFSIPTDIWVYLTAVLLMFIVILFQVRLLYNLLGVKQQKEEAYAKSGIKMPTFFQKINNTVALEDEDTLDMQHNYDGIRELDNKVPGWWSMAFYASILFGVVYLYRMFFSYSLPTQEKELQREQELAAIQKTEYLKTAASNIDENTVTMADAAGIAEGAGLFATNCVACHGDKGQGNSIGPNLTDDYWIHKGSLKDIFTTIKYGVPEKGMISWQNNFSPQQIQDLASFVKSIHNTKPAGAKEPQGELYTDPGATAPAATAPAVAADTTKK